MERVAADRLDPAAAERLLRDGGLAVLPTDTVYGIGAAAYRREACERMLALKGRSAAQPTAIVFGSVENLLQNVIPELIGRTGVMLRRLLPGPLTVVVANPGRRFAYVCGETPDRIGIRVPHLHPRVADLADRVGGIVMSSGNRHGEPPPASLDGVPDEIVEAAAIVVDGGPLPGTASTVVDLTGREPVVLRPGPVDGHAVRAALADGA